MQSPTSFRNILRFFSAVPPTRSSVMRWRYRRPDKRKPLMLMYSQIIFKISESFVSVSSNPGVSMNRTTESPILVVASCISFVPGITNSFSPCLSKTRPYNYARTYMIPSHVRSPYSNLLSVWWRTFCPRRSCPLLRSRYRFPGAMAVMLSCLESIGFWAYLDFPKGCSRPFMLSKSCSSFEKGLWRADHIARTVDSHFVGPSMLPAANRFILWL